MTIAENGGNNKGEVVKSPLLVMYAISKTVLTTYQTYCKMVRLNREFW